MNKNGLIKAICKKTGVNADEVKLVLDAMESTVTETLRDGDNIKIIGFGQAGIKQTRARVSRNPKTGEPVQAEAKRLPVFKFSPAIAEAMEEK